MPQGQRKHGGGRSPNPSVRYGLPQRPQTVETTNPAIDLAAPKVPLDFNQKVNTKKHSLKEAERGSA